MVLKHTMLIMFILLLSASVLAVDFNPRGDVSGYDMFAIKNFTSIRGVLIYENGSRVCTAANGQCTFTESDPLWSGNRSLYYLVSNPQGYYNVSSIINYLQFNTTYSPTVHSYGQIHWNNDDGTLDYDSNYTGTHIQIGQEQVMKVVNKAGRTLVDGDVVYISGAQGNRPKVALADMTNSTKTKVAGVATMTILNNEEGLITTEGLVRDFNTNAWPVGTQLFLGVNGSLTSTEPNAPNHTVSIGYVLTSHLNQGAILVSIRNGYELRELHDVDGAAPDTTGQVLIWNNNSRTWSAGTIQTGNPFDQTLNTTSDVVFNSQYVADPTYANYIYNWYGGGESAIEIQASGMLWDIGTSTLGNFIITPYDLAPNMESSTQPLSINKTDMMLYSNHSKVCTVANGLCNGADGTGGWTNTSTITHTNLSVGIGSDTVYGALGITGTNLTNPVVNIRAGKDNPDIVRPETLPNLYALFNSSGLSSQVNGTYAPNWWSSAGENVGLRTYSGVWVHNDADSPNGYPYVTTHGANQGKMDNMTLAKNWSQPSTIFLVTRQYSSSSVYIMNFGALFDGTPAIIHNSNDPGKYLGHAGSLGTYKSGGTTGIWQIITVVFNGTYSTTCVRGSCTTLNNQGNQNFSSLQLFMWTGGSASNIAEFIIYNETMSTANREGVESFLASKYNIELESGNQQTGNLLTVENSVGDDKLVVNRNGTMIQYAPTLQSELWIPNVLGQTHPQFKFTGNKFMFGDGTQELSDTMTSSKNWYFQSYNNGLNLLSSDNPAGQFVVRTPGGVTALSVDTAYSSVFAPSMSIGTYDQGPDAYIDLQIANAAASGIYVMGAAAQSADLQQWRNSAGTALTIIDETGNLGFGASSPSKTIDVARGSIVVNGSVGQGYYARISNGNIYSVMSTTADSYLKIGDVAAWNGISVGTDDGSFLFVNGFGQTAFGSAATGNNDAKVAIYNDNADRKGLIIRGYTGQTDNLLEWQNSAGNVLAGVASTGLVTGNSFDMSAADANAAYYGAGTNDYMLWSGDPNTVLEARTASTRPLVIKGVTSQTANLTEWQNSAGTRLAVMNASGSLFVETGNQVCTAANGLCTTTIPYQSNAAGWSNDSTTTRTSLDVNITSRTTGSTALTINTLNGQTGNQLSLVNGTGTETLYIQPDGTIASAVRLRLSGTQTRTDGAAYGMVLAAISNSNVTGSASLAQNLYMYPQKNYNTHYGIIGLTRTGPSSVDGIYYNITNMYNAYYRIDQANGGKITNAYNYYISSPGSTTGEVTNLYGIRIADLTTGTTTNYALRTGLGDVLLGDDLTVVGNEYLSGSNLTFNNSASVGVSTLNVQATTPNVATKAAHYTTFTQNIASSYTPSQSDATVTGYRMNLNMSRTGLTTPRENGLWLDTYFTSSAYANPLRITVNGDETFVFNADGTLKINSWDADDADHYAIVSFEDTWYLGEDLQSNNGQNFSLTTSGLNKIFEVDNNTRNMHIYQNLTMNNGEVRLSGDATVWEDLRFPAGTLASGATPPDSCVVVGGLRVLCFNGVAITESVEATAQMPHAWKEGSSIYPHIHWMPSDTATGNVTFFLEYGCVNNNEVMTSTTINASAVANGVAHNASYMSFPAISMTGKTISSNCLFRLYRDPGYFNDTYASDVEVIEFDIHYEIDSMGSRLIGSK